MQAYFTYQPGASLPAAATYDYPDNQSTSPAVYLHVCPAQFRTSIHSFRSSGFFNMIIMWVAETVLVAQIMLLKLFVNWNWYIRLDTQTGCDNTICSMQKWRGLKLINISVFCWATTRSFMFDRQGRLDISLQNIIIRLFLYKRDNTLIFQRWRYKWLFKKCISIGVIRQLRGMIHNKIHLISPGCQWPSIALQCKIVA